MLREAGKKTLLLAFQTEENNIWHLCSLLGHLCSTWSSQSCPHTCRTPEVAREATFFPRLLFPPRINLLLPTDITAQEKGPRQPLQKEGSKWDTRSQSLVCPAPGARPVLAPWLLIAAASHLPLTSCSRVALLAMETHPHPAHHEVHPSAKYLSQHRTKF